MRSSAVPLKRTRLQALRLNAGSYLSEDQELADALALWPDKADLGDLADMFRGPMFKRQYVEDPERGRPYVSASDIDRTDYWGVRLLSSGHGDLLNQLALRSNMTIVTRSGMNLGWAMPIRADLDGVIGSDDLIRVTVKDQKDHGYVSAFLASRLGWVSIRQAISGGSVKHVEPVDLAPIGVPWPEAARRREIGSAFVKAGALRAKSSQLIAEATDAVFTSNGLTDLNAGDWHRQGRELGFTSSASAYSIRAWNYSHKAEALRKNIGRVDTKPLVEWVIPDTLRKGPSFKRIEASGEHAVPLIGQRQLFRFRPRPKLVARNRIPDRAFCDPGTSLVASVGTFGESEVFCRVQCASDLTSGWLYSNHILRVVPAKGLHSGWLYAYLRSRTAFRLMRSLATGSKQQDLHPEGMAGLPVLQGADDAYRSVGRKVKKAFQLRDEAYRLELESMNRLERMVKEVV